MDHCALCPHQYNVVPSDGPSTARILAIAEAPGQNEDRVLRPMVGQAGMEYNNNYLPLAGLERNEIRQANCVSCKPEQNKKPSLELSLCCAEHHLKQEFENPYLEVVLLLGATACDTLVPGVDLESQHGIPFRATVYGWTGWVVPMYHPAAGLHRTDLMIPLLEDFERLKGWIQLDETSFWMWSTPDVGRTRDYRLARTKHQVLQYYLDYGTTAGFFGGDTESHAGQPFSVQISLKIGTGLMVLHTDHEAMQELAGCLREMFFTCGDVLVLHNAEADIDDFRKLVNEPELKIEYIDTMIEAYELQNLPQKLKALSYRLLGRKRQSWQQVVGGYSRDALMAWLYEARDLLDEHRCIYIERTSPKTGKLLKPKFKKCELESVIIRVMTHTSKPVNDDNPYDPWKKLKEAQANSKEPIRYMVDLAWVTEQIGAMPLLGIANCPLHIACVYGNSDADDTLALAYELERLRNEAVAGWNVQEADVDGPRV